MFENRMLKKMFGPRRDKVTGSGGNYIRKRLLMCTAH
jgi:hypothetical protein